MRLNLGSGDYPLHGWVNCDDRPEAPADLYATVPPIPLPDASVDEIYAGHFLEHLVVKDAEALLADCRRVLVPGGRLGVVVPDTYEILRRYVVGAKTLTGEPLPEADLEEVCARFLFGTRDRQATVHRWAYDLDTLARRLEHAGFHITGAIDRWVDARLAMGAWYQCGLDAVKV